MIQSNGLNPKLTFDDIDIYLPRGVKALKNEGKEPRGLFRIFQRYEGASFFGLQEYLKALASLMNPEEIKETIVYAVPEGSVLSKHETAMTLEGPATALLVNETLLHYLSTGTRFRTLSATYPAKEFPWAFMGARYLAPDDLAIATRALSEENILSTVPRWADRYIGTESHSQIAMWGGLKLEREIEELIVSVTDDLKVAATIRATVAFARANPGVPLYVLGDFATSSVGCFETFRATHKVCNRLGLELLGGRMDISKADLNDNPIYDIAALKSSIGPGMSPEIVAEVRRLLNESGLIDFKLVVSSGIKLESIKSYVQAGASIIGIGEEAAYFLNKGECNYTSDAVGYFEEGRFAPFAKEGRELNRIVGEDVIKNSGRNIKIADNLTRYNLENYI